MIEDEFISLSPDFAARFERDPRRPPCQLYLISPPDVTGGFPDALKAALDAGPVAAFQFRVKGVDQHEAARLDEAAPILRRDAADGDAGELEQAGPPGEDGRVRTVVGFLGGRGEEGAEGDVVGACVARFHGEMAAVVAGHADLR